MARNAGRETYLGRIFLARPLRSLSTRAAIRWLVIAFCLVFWIAILAAFIL